MRISGFFRASAVLLVLLAPGARRAAAQSTVPSDTAEHWTEPALRRELLRMGGEDQAIRANLTGDRMQDTVFLRRLMRGDSVRTARLRAIVGTRGWPGRS